MPPQDLVQLLPATVEPVSTQVGTLARPALTVAATLTMAEVEVVLRDPTLGALVVLDPQAPATIGLLSRRRFGEVMTGRLGFGRAVLTRRPVREAADWHPLVVGPESTVVHVAGLAMARPPELLGEDVLVAGDVWGLVSTSVLVSSVVDALVDASSHDRVTSVLSRERLLHTLREWCAAVTGTANRVVGVLTRVEELDAVNAAGGHVAGDAVLRHVATAAVRLAPTGCQVGRIGSGELLTIGVLPDLPDERVGTVVESLRLRMAQAAEAPRALSGRLSRIPWPRALTVATASLPGWAEPDLVVHDARLALGAARLGARPPVHRDADSRR
ncbi:MAG: diguanylate cyclase [Actinobacteria bacterium]|nr:diguanylate cyclase [Actinomycetota bacterium]MCG2800947.1 diguanylate cyclase [Cellulomonas sp.]